MDRWTAKLDGWALWAVRGARYSISGAYTGRASDYYGPPRLPPPLVGEALDVDDLVQRLSADQRKAIEARFLWTVPETLRDRARVLGVSADALRNRLHSACYRLEDLYCERRRGFVRPPVIIPA